MFWLRVVPPNSAVTVQYPTYAPSKDTLNVEHTDKFNVKLN